MHGVTEPLHGLRKSSHIGAPPLAFFTTPNCTLEFKLCSCGHIHGYLRALLLLSPGSPLFIGDPEISHNDLVLHFDGGAFRELQIGGASVAVWKHTAGSLTLLETLCVPIYPCSDATHAEACGAGHAVVLAAKYFAEIRPSHCHQGRQQARH